MAFEPIGIAARRVVASLGVARQERKRAAENENQPPEVPRGEGGWRKPRGGKTPGVERAAATFAFHQREGGSRDKGRPGDRLDLE